MIDLDTPLAVSPDVMLRLEHFGAIALHRKDRKYVTLNRTAARLFRIASGEAFTPRHLFEEALSEGTPPSEETATAISDLVYRGLEDGLLVVSPDARVSEPGRERPAPQFPNALPLSAPVEAAVYITQRCPLECDFCYLRNSDLPILDMETRRIPELVSRLREAGIMSVSVLGGEPLAAPEQLSRLLTEANGEIPLCIVTSGAVHDTRFLEELAENPAIGSALEIDVSVHGASEAVHSLHTGRSGLLPIVGAFIERFSQLCSVCVKCVVTRRNVDELPGLAQWAKARGARGFQAQALMPQRGQTLNDYLKQAPDPETMGRIGVELDAIGGSEAAFFVLRPPPYLEPEPSGQGESTQSLTPSPALALGQCSAVWRSIEITPSGDVYPCCLAMGQPHYRAGNVFESPVNELWRSEAFARFRERRADEIVSLTCRSCDRLVDCRGGCLMNAEILTGNPLSGDPLCPRNLRRSNEP